MGAGCMNWKASTDSANITVTAIACTAMNALYVGTLETPSTTGTWTHNGDGAANADRHNQDKLSHFNTAIGNGKQMSHNIYVYKLDDKLDDKFGCGGGGDDNYYPTRVVVVVTPPPPPQTLRYVFIPTSYELVSHLKPAGNKAFPLICKLVNKLSCN